MSHDLASVQRAPIPLRPLEPDAGRPPLAAPSNLPAALTPLIGRDGEVAALRALLVEQRVRLITLTGPGGVGKTRLAIQVGEEVATAFPDGVVFVPLASIIAPELVLPLLARAVGIRDSGERPLLEMVVDLLRHCRLLLILDNMEHLREVSPLLVTLLASCRNLTLLVTSRVLLRLTGEHAFPVPPLAVTSAQPATAPAVQLFVERARAVQPGFTLNASNVAAIAAVCQQLDGLPLAIELAAARTRVLSPEALLTDLEHRLRLLTDGPRDVPDRLRAMRNTIAWSVDLLAAEERSLFARLGVFVDGFTLEAAQYVGGEEGKGERGGRDVPDSEPASHHEASDVPPFSPFSPVPPSALDMLMSLVDQSLVQRVEPAGEPARFRLLETIRAYALGELAASGEEAAVRDRHAAWCLGFAQRAEPELSGARQRFWFDWLEAEHPNLRAALHWLLSQSDGERGLQLASALTWFWSSRGYFHEARQWLETFLALPSSADTRGCGLLAAANILHWLGDEAQAADFAEESLAIFQREGDAFLAMCALRRLGSIAIDQGQFDEAARLLAESRKLVHSAQPPWDARWDAAFASFLSGRLAMAAGRHDEAIACLTEATVAFQAIGDEGYVAAALGLQGSEWIKLGDLTSARAAYAASWDLAHELNDQTWIAWALVGAAHLTHRDGQVAAAMRLLGAARAMREAIGERRLPESALTPALQAAVRSERFVREQEQGARMTREEVMAAAQSILGIAGGQPDSRSARHMLTAREREVLTLLADGLGDKAIAVTLGISRRTASQHVAAILTKLSAESRTAAVSHALREGLLDPVATHRA